MKKHSLKCKTSVLVLTPEDDHFEYIKILQFFRENKIDVSLSLDGFMDFEGQKLSVSSVIFLKKRDRDADHVLRLKHKIFDIITKNIEQASSLLILNLHPIDPFLFFQISIAYYLKKKMYLYNPVFRDNIFYLDVKAINPIVIHGDLSKMTRDFI